MEDREDNNRVYGLGLEGRVDSATDGNSLNALFVRCSMLFPLYL